MAEDTDKKVDEDWKKRAEAEKERIAQDEDDAEQSASSMPPQPDFAGLVSSYATQALVGMGQFPHPATDKREVHLELAKYAIDTLQMLQEKTKGNLTDDEKKYLDAVLYDLRLRFLDAAG